MSDIGPYASVTHDGWNVSDNSQTAEEMKANLESEEKRPDDAEVDPEKEAKEKTSKAASELGKLGGKAAAEAKAKESKDAKKSEAKSKADEVDSDKETEKPQSKDKAELSEVAEEQETRRNARIERLARERSEERAKREAAERRLAEFEAAEKAAMAPQGDGRPQRTNYQSDEDYADALADHKVQGKLREFAEAQRLEADAKTRAERVTAFKKQVDDELVQALDPRIGHAEPAFIVKDKPGAQVGPENVVAEEFVLSPMAKQVGMHLSQHPEELDEILAAPNYREIVRSFAKLEERLSRKSDVTVPAKETTSAAPRPPRAIPSGGGDVDDDVDSDDTSFERFAKVYNARDQRARRGR